MPLQVRTRGLTELKARFARWNTSVWAGMVGPRAGEVLLEALRLYIAVRTGKTRDSLKFGYTGLHVVAFGDEVAGYLAHGTAPHPIFGFGKPLSFAWHGSPFIRWSVEHPGTKPTFYREHAISTARGEIALIAREEARALLGLA